MRLRGYRRDLIWSHLYFQCSPRPSPYLLWPELVKQCWSGLWLLCCPNTVHSTQKPNYLDIFTRSHHSSVESFLPFSHWKNENGLWPWSEKGPLWTGLPLFTPPHSLCSNHIASGCSSNTPGSGPGTGYALCLENLFPASLHSYLLSGQFSPPQNKVYWPLALK